MVNKQDISLLASSIESGRIVVLPTDTVYGLACSALNAEVVKRLYEVKGREGKPGTIIAGSIQQLIAMGFDANELGRASAYWHGPVSVVLSAPPQLHYLHMGKKSLAVRIPEPAWLQELLAQTGPLATTSANLPGEPTVSTITDAKKLFGDDVAVYIDGGDLGNALPSQILRLLPDGAVERLR